MKKPVKNMKNEKVSQKGQVEKKGKKKK
jgi:hypothetical protein